MTPPDFVELLAQAQVEIERSPLFKRFINGTPLENDIAVWMVEFALAALRRQSHEAERLRELLGTAREAFCSLRCPSVFYSPDDPRHLPECDAMRAAALSRPSDV